MSGVYAVIVFFIVMFALNVMSQGRLD
jgi:hypothetical protein